MTLPAGCWPRWRWSGLAQIVRIHPEYNRAGELFVRNTSIDKRGRQEPGMPPGLFSKLAEFG